MSDCGAGANSNSCQLVFPDRPGRGIVLELSVLGSLVVRVNNEEVRLGPVLRVLVLALLCADGGFVPAARLGELLAWPGGRPTAEATVRSHVSHLRRALSDSPAGGQGAKALASGKAGSSLAYGLLREAVDTDAWLFDRKVSEGHAALRTADYEAAATLLREAMSLWRGDPLSDAAGRPFAQEWAEDLAGRRREARIARMAAEVGAGRHIETVGELERMARRWPDDELLLALLAIARFRAGQSAGAAAACREAILAAQSQGVDTPRLHALQREVLSGTLPGAGLPHLPWAR
jgi:DNA-binding SARP family transcriptional activator